MDNEQLVYLHQNGDKKALERLIEANRGIVIKLATKYNGINKILELDDLIQEGTMGLIMATNKYKFDMDHKAKFITYAVFYIDRYINNCVNGRSEKDINNNKFYKKCTSLNMQVGKEEDKELGDIIEDDNNSIQALEEKIYKEQLRKHLEGVMEEANTLEEREVIKLHYGWNCKPCTLKDIEGIFDYTKNRARSIEDRALRKIRATSWARQRIQEIYKDICNKRRIERIKSKYESIDNCLRVMDYQNV